MKLNKIAWLIGGSSLAVIALICIQINWIRTSKQLMEETFNQRVCMALCSTVEEQYGSGGSNFCAPPSCDVVANTPEQEPGATLFGIEDDPKFQSNLAEALKFYHIDTPYEVNFSKTSETDKEEIPFIKNSDNYTCGTHTSTMFGDTFVNLTFPEKDSYLLGRLNIMLVASIAILLFISSLFFLATWQLWKQKRQTEINIDFFNNMAHEFRTPLTNIALASSRLAKKQPEKTQLPFLGIIKRESQKLAKQVERVLQIAKMENDDYPLVKEHLNLKELLEGVVQNMSLQIKEKEATVVFDKVEADLEIFGDRLHMSNVFKNLIDNSLKYSELPPEIFISTEETPKGIILKFQDNGIGISKADQKLIFEKFQRVNTGNEHSRKGFGLGLAYVKMIIDKHYGKVKVASEMNRGSQFELFLPNA